MLDLFQDIRDEVGDLEAAAERMGVTHAALDRCLARARERGDSRGVYTPLLRRVPNPRARTRSTYVLEKWNELGAGKSYAQIAEEIGVPKNTVVSVVCSARREGKDVLPNTARSARRMIIAEEWGHLRSLGTPLEEAARRLGVHPTTLRRMEAS